MRFLLMLSLLLLGSQFTFAQNKSLLDGKKRQGRLYYYWGWNRGWYSDSDIHFKGNNYDFTLDDVKSKDKPSDFGYSHYFNPLEITISQFNFRVGYFIKENWDVSFGVDHMKYVMRTNQTVSINGYINDTGTGYDRIYDNKDIVLTKDFLKFEHTDGLNYLNMELRRFDEIYSFRNVSINLTEGAGVGMLIPKTNTTLLNNDRYDQFHVSGYGLSGVVALNFTFFDRFFIQTEGKVGYIDMPSIRTTQSSDDSASQSFYFSQLNIVFGGFWKIGENR